MAHIVPPPASKDAARMRRTVTLADSEPEDLDLIEFLDAIANQFGSRRRAMAFVIRQHAAFVAWRERHEYCPSCKRFVTVRPHEAGGGLVIYEPHEREDQPAACPGSRKTAKWTGTDNPFLAAAADAAAQHAQEIRNEPHCP